MSSTDIGTGVGKTWMERWTESLPSRRLELMGKWGYRRKPTAVMQGTRLMRSWHIREASSPALWGLPGDDCNMDRNWQVKRQWGFISGRGYSICRGMETWESLASGEQWAVSNATWLSCRVTFKMTGFRGGAGCKPGSESFFMLSSVPLKVTGHHWKLLWQWLGHH